MHTLPMSTDLVEVAEVRLVRGGRLRRRLPGVRLPNKQHQKRDQQKEEAAQCLPCSGLRSSTLPPPCLLPHADFWAEGNWPPLVDLAGLD